MKTTLLAAVLFPAIAWGQVTGRPYTFEESDRMFQQQQMQNQLNNLEQQQWHDSQDNTLGQMNTYTQSYQAAQPRRQRQDLSNRNNNPSENYPSENW